MKKIGCFLLLLALGTAAVPAVAADLTLFGGFQHPGKITLGSAAQGSLNLVSDPKDFGVFGIRTSQGRVVGSEHTIAYSPNFIESRTKALILNTNLIVHAPLVVARPYVTAGIGAVYTFGDGPADIGTKFALNYGGGIKVSIAGPVGGRLDVRGYTLPSVQSQTLNVLEVTVGVVFGF